MVPRGVEFYGAEEIALARDSGPFEKAPRLNKTKGPSIQTKWAVITGFVQLDFNYVSTSGNFSPAGKIWPCTTH